MDQQRHHTDRDLHPRADADTRRRDDVSGDAGHLVLNAEQVEVHTQRVATGRVTLRKQVVTEEVTVPVTVRHERLEVVEETFDDNNDSVDTGDTVDSPRGAAGDAGASGAARDGETGSGAPRADVRHLDDGDVEITLYAERPVVTVEVVPVERIRVSRGVVTETQTVEVEVDREEAYLDREAADLQRDDRR